MPKLFAYLFRNLTSALLFITLAVTAALWLAQSLRYVDIVVENGAPLHMFVWLALLTLPTFLSLTLPIALFVAVIFTYNRLTHDSELIAMRASGLSPRSLAAPALLLAVIVTITGWLLSIWVQPMASRQLTGLQYFIQSQFSAALLREGVFNNVDNDFTIYVQSRAADSELTGILIHDGRNPKRPVTIRASRGQLVQGQAGPQVIVFDGLQQEFDREANSISELYFDSYAVGLNAIIKSESVRTSMPRERDTFQLFSDIKTEADPVMRARLKAELNQRFSSPLLALTFTLIATCCLLFGEFSRRGQTRRILMAVGFGIVAETMVLGLGQMVGKYDWAFILIYLANLIPIAVGGALLWLSGICQTAPLRKVGS